MAEKRIFIPPAYKELFTPMRYKSYWGGRGSAKSWSFARTLLILGTGKPLRILCTREFQSSIADSVHKLLSDQIHILDLEGNYTIQNNSIKGICGSEFIFKGLRFNINEIKSMEGIDIVWCEEAQSVSEDSWKILIPTIRKENSEIWLSWNTGEIKDATYQRFVVNPPDNCLSKLVSWRDNPYFPETLRKEMEYCKKVDKDAYNHIWEGSPRFISDALVFKDKFYVDEEFEAPDGAKLLYGVDWGFSNDPTTLVRSFIIDNDLYIEYEAYGVGVEFEEIPALFDSVPLSRNYMIPADNSRPETISYIRRKGFNVVPCKKWSGSVEDGVSFMRKFNKIHVHKRCIHVKDELEHYSYKKDRMGNILSVLCDSFNHTIDAVRYSLEDLMGKGSIDWVRAIG